MDFNSNYILNPYAKKVVEDLQQDYNDFMDKNLSVNSIYRNSDGSIKNHNYNSFGIVSNTPGLNGIDLGFPWK